MDDLVQFLLARLDEDEQTAREAGGRWEVLPVSGWIHTAPAPSHEWQHPGFDHHVASVSLDRDRAHIVRHDPARVLAEVDAKRQALDHYERIQLHTLNSDGGDDYIFAEGAVRQQISFMALSYADHPDYREEWRPGFGEEDTGRHEVDDA